MSETITLKKETAIQLTLLIDNLMAGKKPFYKKQKNAFEILKKEILESAPKTFSIQEAHVTHSSYES